MMLDNANIFKARGYAVQGAAFGVFLLVFALITFRLGPLEVALTFVPLIGVYLWPKNATTGLSSAFIFMLGMAVDVLSGGPIGLWAFLYLLLYGVFRPDLRGRHKGLISAWGPFCVWVGLTIVIIAILGAVFITGRTSWGVLLIQALIGSLLFPIFYGLNSAINKIFAGEDGFEGAT